MAQHRFLQSFGLDAPIIQAPMAGGGDPPALVAAVSNAGALGCIGAAYLTPAQIDDTSRAVRSLTTRPFGINLFAPVAPDDPSAGIDAALEGLAPYYEELGIDAPRQLPGPASTFDEQVAAVLESGASVFSF